MKKLVDFCSRKVIACHSKPSVHKNAGVMRWAKRSYAGPLTAGVGGGRVCFGFKNEGKGRKQFKRASLEWGAPP